MKIQYLDRFYKHHEGENCSTLSVPIAMISDYISNNRKKIYEKYGLSKAEVDALFALNSFQKEVTAAQISDALLFTSGGISKVLKKLEDKALISRKVSQEDKRSALICIEKAGLKIVAECVPQFHTNDDAVFSLFNDKEKEILRKMLKKLLYSVSEN